MHKYKTVDEFLNDLNDSKRLQVNTLRKYILQADPTLVEHIKWNAPSYVKDGEDRITFNTLNKQGLVKLVFHMGATRKEDRKAEQIVKDTQFIEWVSDIRGYATFNDLQQIQSQKNAIQGNVRKWLATNVDQK